MPLRFSYCPSLKSTTVLNSDLITAIVLVLMWYSSPLDVTRALCGI